MATYTTLSGEVIDLPELSAELEDFYAQSRVKAQDPNVSVAELVDWLYGEDNPLLERGVVPGHGFVTREAFEHPLYRVLMDLLGHKRIQKGTLDPAAAKSTYKLSVAAAAHELGISTSAVRLAIREGRLPAEKRGRFYFLRQEDVDGYHVGAQGPDSGEAPVLAVTMGSDDAGRSLSVRHDDGATLEVTERDGNLRRGTLRDWTLVAIRTTSKHDGTRFYELQPAKGAPEIVSHGPDLQVRGRFKVARKINNTRLAVDAWRSFGPGEE